MECGFIAVILRFPSRQKSKGTISPTSQRKPSTPIFDVKKMFELGQKMLKEKPLFFLCENANCPFCSNAQRLQAERDAAKNG